jgi:predicted enzyme related to lactoylglutathione lyase
VTDNSFEFLTVRLHKQDRFMKPSVSASLMPVSDLAKSLEYYLKVLGFSKRFEYGGFYAGIEMGPVQIHLNTKARTSPGSGDVYIFCDEVDGYYEEITRRGAKVEAPPKTYDYGMRDFASYDPDGNRVSFGTPIGEA